MTHFYKNKWVIISLLAIAGLIGLLAQSSNVNLLYMAVLFLLSVALGASMVYGVLQSRMDRLTNLSSTDSITGLYNAQEANRLLKYDIERSRRYKGELSVVLLDIDNFSEVNDTYGRKKGNQVLKKLSKIIVKGAKYIDQEEKEYHGIRTSDIAFRYPNEDKILIIMPETSAKGAFIAADRIREAVMFTPFSEAEAEDYLRITVSASVVSFNPDSDTGESLLKRANLLLLKSKITKNHVVIENPINNGLVVFGNKSTPWLNNKSTT